MNKREQGLTMIEMIVVLSILVLMVGLMIPMIENFHVNHTALKEREHLKEIEAGVNAWMRDEIFRKGTINTGFAYSGAGTSYLYLMPSGVLGTGTGRCYLTSWFEDEEQSTPALSDVWGQGLTFQNVANAAGVRDDQITITSRGLDTTASTADDITQTVSWAPWVRKEGNFRTERINSMISVYNQLLASGLPPNSTAASAWTVYDTDSGDNDDSNDIDALRYLRPGGTYNGVAFNGVLNTDPRWKGTGDVAVSLSTFLRMTSP